MTKIRASDPRDIGSIPDIGKSFRSSYPRRPNRLWDHTLVIRGCFLTVKPSIYEPG